MAALDAVRAMRAALEAVEIALDPQIYPEQVKDDFEAPDDRAYTVTITADLWRQIGRALTASEQLG